MSVKKQNKALPKKPKRSKSPSRPPKRRKPKVSVRKTLIRMGVFAVIAGLVAVTILWRKIDRQVSARLTSFETPSIPVIYSAPLDLRGVVNRVVSEGAPNPKEALKAILADRRYTELPYQPARPGEYSLTNDTLVVYTRDFTTSSGAPHRAQKVSISLKDSPPQASPQQQRALLEPQIISYIGAEEMRASRFVALDQIPLIVQQAVIAIEDERFYAHFGIDIFGIARAMARNIIAGRLVQGGSTLTQQLAKNLFLSPKKTITRKLMEVPTALSLERHLSKKQLLELYLNEVYLGQEGSVSIHGMPQAATTLFGKRISDISVEEAATLAGIIKAPSHYNPRKHLDRAQERRDIVLGKMRDLGYISTAEYNTAVKKPLRIAQQQEHRRIASYFTTALESELSESIDIENAPSTGLAVYTGLDLGMQRCAELAVERGMANLEASHPKLKQGDRKAQAALVAIEPYSGLVRAWVGGRDYSESQFNRVNLAVRQIGSTVKPFLYLTALDGSLNSYKTATAVSILEDKPMSIEIKGQDSWVPENYDHEFRGDVTLRYALEHSLNMPALYIAEKIGLSTLKDTLSAFKLAPNVQEVPALALGALDTNLLRLTSAYGALANSGIYVQPRLFSAALDGSNDRVASSEVVEERVANEDASYIVTSILEGVLERGTGKGARSKGFTRQAAGKTGTSDNARDAWFVGYTPTLVAGVWVGFDDNSPISITGGAAAAPIWGDFMKCSSSFIPPGDFIAPPGVVQLKVDSKSGELATSDCPDSEVITEVFVRGTEPTKRCSVHSDGAEESVSDDPAPSRGSQSGRQSGFWRSLFGN